MLDYLSLIDLQQRELRPSGRFRMVLALVKPYGHVSHPIRAILRSFQIFYFYTDVFISLPSFCSHAESTMNEVVGPLHGIPVSYCLYYGPSYYFPRSYHLSNRPTRQFCTTGGKVRYRDCIDFAVYTNSQATMAFVLPSQGLEKTTSEQTHNLLNKI